ncbi:MAG: general secretion pathway protein GspB [Gammaproteobacteria bacterium]|nr:general secretion pathway protein GspB [Gammaproteobacteria bacterium]
MSYILDALKKSEQDRGNGSVPNVQTIHSSALNYHQEKRALWPWLLVAALIINVFILIYFLKPATNTTESTSHQNTVTNTSTATNENSTPEEIKPASPVMVSKTPAVISPAPAQNNNEHTEVVAKEMPAAVITIDELPDDIRRQIPNMIFSAHVYSSEPLQRSIVINDRFMEEGEAVAFDLILVEITRHGAIFDFRDYRFSTSVLSGWGTP